MEFYQYGYNTDNYGVLLHDRDSGQTACVDAGDCDVTLEKLAQKGWGLSCIWITHHHWDHTDGLAALKRETGAHVFGPGSLLGVDTVLKGGDSFRFGNEVVEVLDTPGHTLDMLSYHLPSEAVAFTGDSLFSMGCGRLFEGTPVQMYESLQKLMTLPAQTMLYCSHEYTQINGQFALSVDPDNLALKARLVEVERLRCENLPTIPVPLAVELQTNPFLRVSDAKIRAQLGMEQASDVEVFAALRARRDGF